MEWAKLDVAFGNTAVVHWCVTVRTVVDAGKEGGGVWLGAVAGGIGVGCWEGGHFCLMYGEDGILSEWKGLRKALLKRFGS